MNVKPAGGVLVALGVALFAILCCGAPLLLSAVGAAAFAGVLTLFHGWAARIGGLTVLAGLAGIVFVVRRQQAACALRSSSSRTSP